MHKFLCFFLIVLSAAAHAQTISSPSNPDKVLPTGDNITLQATAGFPVSKYSWQWGIDNFKVPGAILWMGSLPAALQGKNNIQLNAKDILGASAEYFYLGADIYISLGTLGVPPKPVVIWSNIVTLNVRLSAPHIVSVTPIIQKCFGGNTGSAKIQFDRALGIEERLSITLYDLDKMIPISGKNNLTELELGNVVTLDSNLAPGRYQIGLIGKPPFSATSNYVDAPTHRAIFQITAPSNINFPSPIKLNDVRCFGGNDGGIYVRVNGGTRNYKLGYKNEKQTNFTWVDFPKPPPFFPFFSLQLNNLTAGTYIFKIIDANGCYPKDLSNNEVTQTITINQPAEPLHVDFSEVTDPLAFGRTDGKVKVILKGGTPKAGGKYTLSWKKSDGTILPNITNTVVATGYQTELQNIGIGKYILSATDSNFTIATGGATQGCILQDTFTVNQPPPLTVEVNEYKYVSCKGEASGAIVAHGSGGVPITTGSPYTYQWFKKEATDIDINKSDSIVDGLMAGKYYVKITDRNGIQKISGVFTLTEPDSLKIGFTTATTVCTSTGNIQANITGGTTPYRIAWTTGDSTTAINNQPEGDYLAYVTDARGCETMANIHLAIPGGIKIDTAILQRPSYYNSNNGAVQLTVSGGKSPYSYQWNTGATTKDIQGLMAGDYSIVITDQNGCTKTQSYTLRKPSRIMKLIGVPLPIEVATKTLCTNQILALDATISDGTTQYEWHSDNGFTAHTAKVDLTNAGKYWVNITDSRGVTGSDTIIIKKNNAVLDANFMSTTQAFKGEKVVFINVSYPVKPEHITWLIPNDPKINIQQNNQTLAELIFADTGTYYISMRATTGDCEQVITRKVIVLEPQNFDDMGEIKDPFIKEFTIAPNPSNGKFNAKITLQEACKIRVRIVSVGSGATINNQALSGSSQYLIPYNITLAPGIYFLLLETPQGGVQGSRVRKIIIN